MIRRANTTDIDFLITAIIEAEKSGSEMISYCGIFNITEAELIKALRNMLDENVEGQELCISSFMIAEENGEKAAALAAWVEGKTGRSASAIKNDLLIYFLDRQKVLLATENISLMNEIGIDRTPGTLQIESVYTAPKFRGKGLSKQLIEAQITDYQKSGDKFEKVQVFLLGNNIAATKSYEKAGFTIVKTKQAANKAINKILSSDTRVLMERSCGNPSENGILSQLNSIFAKVLKQPTLSLTPTTVATDVNGWTSLNHMILIDSVEEHFKIKFKLNEIMKFKNVGEMVATIEKKIS